MYIERIQKILSDLNIQSWLIITAENRDPYFKKLIDSTTSSFSAALITTNSADVIVHTLDSDNLSDKTCFHVHQYNSKTRLTDVLNDIIKKRSVSQVALNYTTISDVMVDTIGHGTFTHITEEITKENPDVKFQSAEAVIYGLYDIKTETELAKMRVAANRAHEILMKAFQSLKAGMSENNIVDLVHEIFETKPTYFEKEGVIQEEYSWEKEACPIVLTGDSFLKGGHAMSSERILEKGNTIYFDFGVKLTFSDGSSWSSDIQRTGYFLKENETSPPHEIQQRFDAIINSISLGIESAKPKMKGFELDEIVRKYLLNKGFPDYDHATGHAIGEVAHNPGTVISHKREGMSALDIHENGVYTIEPRIALTNGVSIEEMVVIKDDGNSYTLCERQTKPILIK